MTIELVEIKKEYSVCLHKFIDLKLKHAERYSNFRRMQEIEEELAKRGDRILIVISTINTWKGGEIYPTTN